MTGHSFHPHMSVETCNNDLTKWRILFPTSSNITFMTHFVISLISVLNLILEACRQISASACSFFSTLLFVNVNLIVIIQVLWVATYVEIIYWVKCHLKKAL